MENITHFALLWAIAALTHTTTYTQCLRRWLEWAMKLDETSLEIELSSTQIV